MNRDLSPATTSSVRHLAWVAASLLCGLVGACTPTATGRTLSSPATRSSAATQPTLAPRQPEEPSLSAGAAVLVEAASSMPTLESELASVQEALAGRFASPEVRAELEREAERLRGEIEVVRQRIQEAAASELRMGEAALAARDLQAARRVASVLERVVAVYPTARPFIDRVAEGLPAPGGCVVMTREPDPTVVTDAAALERMKATGLPCKIRHEKTGIVLLLCPPGEFMMGSPSSETGRGDDEVQHRRVIRRAYYLSETEVTQEQWKGVMGSEPSKFKNAANPVQSVSWVDCKRFCETTGLRLPSEAEWEYACRAGTTGAHAGQLDALGWYDGNSGGRTHPVATKQANPWGLYDTHGNVWEWCEDFYGDYPAAGGTEEPASSPSSRRVLRGGSWNLAANDLRSSDRSSDTPGVTYVIYGFRVARTP
jgi:formylglycine-generating enzyme required for sulfatase activity